MDHYLRALNVNESEASVTDVVYEQKVYLQIGVRWGAVSEKHGMVLTNGEKEVGRENFEVITVGYGKTAKESLGFIILGTIVWKYKTLTVRETGSERNAIFGETKSGEWDSDRIEGKMFTNNVFGQPLNKYYIVDEVSRKTVGTYSPEDLDTVLWALDNLRVAVSYALFKPNSDTWSLFPSLKGNMAYFAEALVIRGYEQFIRTYNKDVNLAKGEDGKVPVYTLNPELDKINMEMKTTFNTEIVEGVNPESLDYKSAVGDRTKMISSLLADSNAAASVTPSALIGKLEYDETISSWYSNPEQFLPEANSSKAHTIYFVSGDLPSNLSSFVSKDSFKLPLDKFLESNGETIS